MNNDKLVFELKDNEWYKDSNTNNPLENERYRIFKYDSKKESCFYIENNNYQMYKRMKPAIDFFGFYKATDKEVLSIFIKESKRRKAPQNDKSIYVYNKETDSFYIDNTLAYKSENWLFDYPSQEELLNRFRNRINNAFKLINN